MIHLEILQGRGHKREITLLRAFAEGKHVRRRTVNKLRNALRRRLRQDMVHSAGDVFRDCVIVLLSHETVRAARLLDVRVPRSLRALNRWTAAEIDALRRDPFLMHCEFSSEVDNFRHQSWLAYRYPGRRGGGTLPAAGMSSTADTPS